MIKKVIFFVLSLLIVNILAAQYSVEGVVIDKKGMPIVGVSVSEKGTNNRVETNQKGQFKIIVQSENQFLIFSHVGFKKHEFVANNSKSITLLADGEDLQEVVVTALGITKQSKTLGYSVSQLKGEQFTESRTANIGNALSGKVAGVNISPPASGVAGSSRVVIRGGSSLGGNEQPLYIVNGVPIESANQGNAGIWGGNDAGDGLTLINPDDIETLSVLKGNTAAALYGSRAANGVIIITTKSGAKTKKGMGVSFNNNTTFDRAYNLTDFQNVYGPGNNGQVAVSKTDALQNGSLTNWGKKYDGALVWQFDTTRPYTNTNETLNDFYRIGVNSTNTIAFSGGDANTNYRFSVSDLRAQDIVPNSTLARTNFNFNIFSKLGKKLTLQVSGQYNKQTATNRPRLSDPVGSTIFLAIFKTTTLPFSVIKGATGRGDLPNGQELRTQSSVYITNPYWAAYNLYRQDKTDRIVGNVSLRYDITKWLYLQGRLGTDFSVRNDKSYTGYGTAYAPLGDAYESFTTNREDNYDFILGFKKDINKISVDAFLGGNALIKTAISKSGGGNNFVIPFFNSINNLTTSTFSYGYSQTAINSTYGSFSIGWDNYLFLNLTGRNDVFSTLAPQSNSIFYSSAGLSFILSDVVDLGKIDFLKFRASIAQVGGGAPDPYGLYTTYNFGNQSPNGASLGYISNASIPNAKLQPYSSTEYEFGIDLRLLKNRLAFDIALYNRKTIHGILGLGISPTSGFNSTTVNIAELRNRGIEVLINATPISTKGFEWKISFNMAYNQSTVLNLGKDAFGNNVQYINLSQSRIMSGESTRHVVGQPAGVLYGFKHRTINGVKVYDSNTGYPIQSLSVEQLGLGRAPLSGGITNTFTYKNFKLDFLIDMRFGAKIISGTNNIAYDFGLHKSTLEGRETGLSFSGVDQNGNPRTWNIPANLVQNYYQTLSSITETFTYDASYVKLRQFSFGYIFPTKWFRNKIQGLTASIVARNILLLWSNVPNIDPESTYSTNGNDQGFEFFSLPQSRNIGFNISFNF